MFEHEPFDWEIQMRSWVVGFMVGLVAFKSLPEPMRGPVGMLIGSAYDMVMYAFKRYMATRRGR